MANDMNPPYPMINDVKIAPPQREARSPMALPPVQRRKRWIAGGLAVQAVGIGIVLAWVIPKIKHNDAGGKTLRSTLTLVWHQSVHSHAGIAVLVASAVLFAAGSMLLARPYVRSLPMLLLGVPIAAVAGLVVLGGFVLIVAVIVALLWFTGEGSGPSGKRKAPENPPNG